MRLTDISVRNLAAPDRGQKTYLDDSLSGFGVRVSQGGAKSFVLVYGPSRERTTIGRYPAISLQEARAKAREVIAERVLGKERAPSIGFSEAVRQFITTHCEANNKPRSAQETARLLNRHFLPPFRRVGLRDVKTTAITKIIDGLQDRPALAGHAFTAARTFFHWAVRRRLLPHSPMEGLQMPRKPASRDRVLTDAELTAVWALAPELGTFGTILRLLILTGQRCAQIAGLRAEHIDYADRVITWPPALMKGNRQHSIPYGEAVAEILEPLPKVGLLFPARGRET